MTVAVLGATGRVGSEVVGGLLARGDTVCAIVRDPDKARRAFGEPSGLHIRATTLNDPRDLTAALEGVHTVFIAMGSIGTEGVLQRIAINVASTISSIEQVTRLSVLNASAESLGINQRAHHSIDQFAAAMAVPYSTIRPTIFSASLLAAAHEVRSSHTWTGLGRHRPHGSHRPPRIVVRDEVWKQMRLGVSAVMSFDADLRLSRGVGGKGGDIQLANLHKPDMVSVGDADSQAAMIAKDLLELADIKILGGTEAARRARARLDARLRPDRPGPRLRVGDAGQGPRAVVRRRRDLQGPDGAPPAGEESLLHNEAIEATR